ncbi:hypothetical protein T4D_13622 [Trichinella pseudospiralis]|uniref:Uncharacterized protein n=1 Tax=Trichinella pseudospiralis TaxID=6337 RepID=A0A0V1G3P2_TRIPS|nr:hypothetical protein T4D_13622 [Trichinella pseudospiralis]
MPTINYIHVTSLELEVVVNQQAIKGKDIVYMRGNRYFFECTRFFKSKNLIVFAISKSFANFLFLLSQTALIRKFEVGQQ